MPVRNPDLHGNVPDKSRVALLIIDVINDLEWPGGDRIQKDAMRMAEAIAKLQKRARKAKVPSIYVNDNFGRWKSDFQAVVDHVIEDQTRGAAIAALIKPDKDDYFVLKPKHSGFFSTTLDTLLEYLGVETLILTGLQTNICVLFTANEAYMRDFHLLVPEDCSASETRANHRYAMEQIRSILKADTRKSDAIDFGALAKKEAHRVKRKGRDRADGSEG